MKSAEIIKAVLTERHRQDKVHGPAIPRHQRNGEGYSLGVLTEENGEVAKEVNEYITSCNCIGKHITYSDHKRRLKIELIQTAAVCFAWLESL